MNNTPGKKTGKANRWILLLTEYSEEDLGATTNDYYQVDGDSAAEEEEKEEEEEEGEDPLEDMPLDQLLTLPKSAPFA